MSGDTQIVLGGISLPYYAGDEDIIRAAADKMKRAGYSPAALRFGVFKKSIDARRRDSIKIICSVLVSGLGDTLPGENVLKAVGGKLYAEPELTVSYGREKLRERPLIVGTGPAGMFCGLLLAKNGYSPVLIERGGAMSDRVAAVERFTAARTLDGESNIQFGAGGAGTFSDGKLVTRISDARCSYVLKALYEYGAPKDILTQAKPHIGTDILRQVSANLLSDIEKSGGSVIYDCRLDSFDDTHGTPRAYTGKGELDFGVLVLAPGHSARDTYAMLLDKAFAVEPKAFSIGVRIEHLQSDIDRALYGAQAGDPRLGHAEYALSDTTGERGVYTFCMCPGGEVAAASSEQGCLVVNGMSRRARDGRNANSAVAVSILPADFGNTPQGAVEFQRITERAAFVAGGGDFCAPVQTAGDFLNGRVGSEPGRIVPTYMNGNVRCADLTGIFPDFVTETLMRGLRSFGHKLPGFDVPDAVLTGAETRTSSPVRILRGDDLTAVGHSRIYPCGEGAGYAGGIMSAAVDGIRVAQAIMERYAPMEDV